MKSSVFFLLWISVPLFLSAQARTYSDAAQMYNRMLLENGNNVMQIGNFKVKGTPFLYGGRKQGQIFMNGKNPIQTFLSYNTYEQTIEYSSASTPDAQLYKPDGNIDSFTVAKNNEFNINEDILFISGKLIAASDNAFYQQLERGKKFSLYKKYKSELAIVSTNYVQSDLRQFDLQYEYYYLDIANNKLKKLKTGSGFLKKEFKEYPIDSIVNDPDFSYDPEKYLKKLFLTVNQ